MRPGPGQYLVHRLNADGSAMEPVVHVYRPGVVPGDPGRAIRRKVVDVLPAPSRAAAARLMAEFLDIHEDVLQAARRLAGVHHVAVEDAVGNRQRFIVRCISAQHVGGNPANRLEAQYEASEVIGDS